MNKQELRALLVSMGWTEDRFGNFKSKSGKYRVHIQAISIRVERLVEPLPSPYGYTPPKQWLNIVSDYMKDLKALNGRLVIKGKALRIQE